LESAIRRRRLHPGRIAGPDAIRRIGQRSPTPEGSRGLLSD